MSSRWAAVRSALAAALLAGVAILAAGGDSFDMNGVDRNSPLFQKTFKGCGGPTGAPGASFSSSEAANGSTSARK